MTNLDIVPLVDQINLEIKQNTVPIQAIIDASMSRMRPVLLAAITTVLGMIPLLTDAFFVSMAVVIMFGLAFATGINFTGCTCLICCITGQYRPADSLPVTTKP